MSAPMDLGSAAAAGGSSIDNPEVTTMWRVRKTIHAMLAERGYLLTQDDMSMTIEDFKATFGDSPKSVVGGARAPPAGE